MPDYLRAALLDLLHELEVSDVRLMLGGGYGLFLKQEHLASSDTTTLISLPGSVELGDPRKSRHVQEDPMPVPSQ